MIIDGHAHACGDFLTCEQLEACLKERKVDKVVLCGGEPESKKNYSYPMFSNIFHGEHLAYVFNRLIKWNVRRIKAADHIREQNMMVYAMMRKLPDRILNAYWINPADPDCIKNMEDFYKHYGFCIIKMHQCWNTFDIDSDTCNKIFAWAAKNNKPIFLHLYNKKQVKKFIQEANKHKDTAFVLAHMIGAKTIRGKLKYRNVYFDLSAPELYSKRMVKKILATYGASRLVLGTDTPYGSDNFGKIVKRLKRLPIHKEEYREIMGDNLKWLLKL